MTDREARERLARLIQDFRDCRINGNQFTDGCFSVDGQTRDPGVYPICERLVIDIGDQFLRGRYALTEDEWAMFSRCILFLKSEFEYQWPNYDFLDTPRGLFWVGLVGSFLVSLGLGLAWLRWYAKWILPVIIIVIAGSWFRRKQQWRRLQQAGDFSVWPFVARADYEKALAQTESQGPTQIGVRLKEGELGQNANFMT
ncbi:MAG: hypothetical protein AB1696_06660 [Planctomycetota bacterium]